MENNTEIEKKYLVKDESWRGLVYDTKTIYQAYFSSEDKKRKRIRIVKEDEQAIVAYKEDIGVVNGFLKRLEIEDEIDYKEGLVKLIKQNKVLVKKRNYIKHGEFTLEVDEFLNLDKPLVMVEIEVKSEQLNQLINLPQWFGKDVTLSKKYRNASLVQKVQNSEEYLKELLNNKKKLKP